MVIRRPSSLALMLAATLVIALLFVLRLNRFPIEALSAVPLVLFLPGYALTFALFARNMLDIPERLLLSFALSIAVAIVGGALLNLTPWGLRTGTWVALLIAVTLAAGVFALFKKHEPVMTTVQWRGRVPVRDILLYEIALLAVLGALWLAAQPAPSDRINGYTSLWVVPNGTGTMAFTLGLNSSEVNTTRYRLELKLDDQLLSEWPNIVLEPGEAWNTSFDLSALPERQIVAALYRADRPTEIYRQVVLQL